MLSREVAFSDRLPIGWTHPEPADLKHQFKNDLAKNKIWSLEDRGPRGIFLPRTLATSWHRFVIKTNAKVPHKTFLMSHTKFAKWGVFPFHELQSKK